MTKVISFRVTNSQYEVLSEEAASIPNSLSEHLKSWILNRNEILMDEYNQGVKDCENGKFSKE